MGRGGMGAVYKGRQTSLDRPVAIKILSNQLEDTDASFAERFKNEARALGKLSHPGIVGVYEFGEAQAGLLYIVMEFIDGTDVAKMIAKQGRLHTEHAMAITAHVCDALAYAHERGIIHRDIKPANIMVGYDGVVKVADFGLAKMTQSTASGLTQSGMAMGTLHYMAPEALTLGSEVDQRADIYAVGVMLYQMLTGKLPQGMFEMPSLQIKGLDPRYDRIVATAMRDDRELRYPSAKALRLELDAILTQPVVKVEASTKEAQPALNTQARPKRYGAGHDLQPQVRNMTGSNTEEQQAETVTKPRGGLAWAALLVIAVFGGIAWLVLYQPKDLPALSVTDSSDLPTGNSATSTASLLPATKESPFINTLGMKFVPVAISGGSSQKQELLFSVWHTRVQDYQQFSAANPGLDDSWKSQEKDGVPVGKEPDHPVVGVSWEDAQAFCKWLTQKETAEGRLAKGLFYRLPSDEEWSWAADVPLEGGTIPREKHRLNITVFPWGQEWPPRKGAGNFADESFHEKFPKPDAQRPEITNVWIESYKDGYATTSPVGVFQPNRLGLYDMVGNAWQWCEDWWDSTKKERVLRGGSWRNNDHLNSNFRHFMAPLSRYNYLGFRCVLGFSAISISSNPAGSAEMLNAPAAAPQNQPAGGTTIDLLRLINPANDAVRGRWEWTPEGLKLFPKAAVSTIEFPYEPPEFYDFTIEFSVKESKYRQVDQILTCQGVATSWQMGAGYAPSGSFGLMMVDGIKAIDPNRKEAVVVRERLSPNVRHRSTVQVRKNWIRAILDGKEILNWEGEFNRLDLESQSRLKSVNRLGISGFGTEAIFHLAEVKPAEDSTTKATNDAPKLSEEMTVAAGRGGRLRAWGNFYERGVLRPIDVSKAAGYSDFVTLAGDDARLYALRKNQVLFALDWTDRSSPVYEKPEVQRLFRDRIWPHYQNGIFIIHREGVTVSLDSSVGPLRAVAASFGLGGYACIPDTGKAFWLPVNGNRRQERPPPFDLIHNAADAAGISYGIAVVSKDGRLRIWNFEEVIETSTEYSDIVEIRGGLNFALCRKRDGSVLVWPPASYKKGYLPDPGVQRVPTLPPAVQIRCGSDVGAAQMPDGRWIGWGADTEVVTKISSIGKALDIAIPGRHHSTVDNHGYLAWIEPLPAAQLPPELAALDTQFRALDKERVTVPYEDDLAKLNNSYLASLQKAIAAEKAASRQGAVPDLEAEQKRLVAEGSTGTAMLRDEDDATAPLVLRNLRTIWRVEHANLLAARAARLKTLADPLERRLTALEADFIRASRQADSAIVSAHRQSLGQSMADATAAAALAVKNSRYESPDQACARWALGLNGEVWKVGSVAPMKSAADILKADFKIEKLVLNDMKVGRGAVASIDIGRLDGLKGLRWLDLRGQPLNESGVAKLESLDALQALDLHACRITDGLLSTVSRLHKLTRLDVGYNKDITDKGAAQLSNLVNLEWLNIYNSSVTDQTLTVLADLPKLKYVQIHRSKVTEDGVRAFRRSRPDCSIQAE